MEGADGQKKPIPVEDVDSLYLYGEVDLNTKALTFLATRKSRCMSSTTTASIAAVTIRASTCIPAICWCIRWSTIPMTRAA